MSLKAYFTSDQFYDMDGPHTSVEPLLKKSGVYLITTRHQDNTHKVIDVGESHNVHERVSSHDRSQEWQKHIADTLYVSTLYCNEQTRMIIEQQLRMFHKPPVGVR
ncbi:hypothetical protein CVV43_04555 [Candidatus Saccharibacteria bacterium HGW-Saccharibacteria-1]|jgi:excinuclease UvrABC nuclease subunit|nr:MAG: hypothetical protein CVV43_04555 [Candidatus Saccharibacteria bacterium HGW-Saccharibacteria-1]